MLENFLTILRKLLNMPDLKIVRAGETVSDGLRKVPLRAKSYILCIDAGVDWNTIFLVKSLCEFVLVNLDHLQQVVEERHLLENEFALVISSAAEFLLHRDVITDRFSFLKKIACYALFQDDQTLFNIGLQEATLVTSRQKLDRTSEFLISIGAGELFGYSAGAFKCIVKCESNLRKITMEAVKMRLLWLDRIHREKLRADAEHKAKEALQRSNQCLSTIMDSMDAAVYIADMDTHELLFVNKTLKNMFGDDMEGQPCWQYLQQDMSGPCDFCTNHKLISADGEPTGIFAWESQNTGTGRWFDCRDQAILWIDGRLVRMTIATDITDRKQAEEEKKVIEEKLRRAQKMEAIGLMAGGVAHDLNNILSGIVSYPELLLLKLPADSPLRKPITTIQESGNRAAAVVADLLTVARGVASVQEVANLNDLVNEYIASAEHIKIKASKSSVVVKFELAPDLFNISCSSIHINKALMNLIINAFEAIELSGTIVVSTANQYFDASLKEIKIGQYVALSISDDGSGISRDDLERIFDPFYTKKMMGRSGTGLGLTVVWNTMQDHDGYIDVKSDEKGTIFKLYFPAVK
ncbi:MAG: PAS domain S-box protein, partial [Desulfobacterales bacterium]|nr:PAS domain S-box protein [Desulfobacterales bacterium]